MTYGVAMFHTTSAAIKAEKALKDASFDVKPIPTPRQYSSDCGIAIRFDWSRAAEVKAVLQQERIETAGIHCMD